MTSQLLINTIFQLIIFTLIPFLWWFFSARKSEKFLIWIGLIKPEFNNSKTLILSVLAIIIMLLLGIFLTNTFEDSSVLASYQFSELGFGGIIPVLIYAFFQTGLSEEILFRGFLGKRLSHKFGFTVGNIVQSVLFGLVHGVLLFGNVPISLVILVVVLTSAFGWLMGYLNEKMGNGSIIPSWIIHGLVNTISAFLVLF